MEKRFAEDSQKEYCLSTETVPEIFKCIWQTEQFCSLWLLQFLCLAKWAMFGSPSAVRINATAAMIKTLLLKNKTAFLFFIFYFLPQTEHNPSNWTCWWLIMKPLKGLLAIGTDKSVRQNVWRQLLQVKWGWHCDSVQFLASSKCCCFADRYTRWTMPALIRVSRVR